MLGNLDLWADLNGISGFGITQILVSLILALDLLLTEVELIFVVTKRFFAISAISALDFLARF